MSESIGDDTPMKVCRVCSKRLPLTEFNVDKQNKDGHKSMCRECHSFANKTRIRNGKLPGNAVRVLRCKECREDKTYEEFYSDKAYPHGRNTDCCCECLDALQQKIRGYQIEASDEKKKRDIQISQLVNEGSMESLIESINLLKAKIKDIDAVAYEGIDELIADMDRGPYAPRTPAKITSNGDLIHPIHGHLYVLQEREFVKCGEPIYKIGQTQKENPTKRLNQYPNNSNIIDVYKVYDPIGAESELLRKLDALCGEGILKQRKDIGREYFEGDLSVIQACMRETIYGYA